MELRSGLFRLVIDIKTPFKNVVKEVQFGARGLTKRLSRKDLALLAHSLCLCLSLVLISSPPCPRGCWRRRRAMFTAVVLPGRCRGEGRGFRPRSFICSALI